MASLVERIGYGMAQTARVAWYAGHYMAARRMAGPVTRPGGERVKPSGPIPSRDEMLRVLRETFEQDWAHIAAGDYLKPYDMAPDPVKTLVASARFFRDVPKVDKRRLEDDNSEVFTEEVRGKYPRYYLQNFHYQTGGWLSEDSPKLYDMQVEVLFAGTADAMRRSALPPITRYLKGRDQRKVSLLDVACGTGRFLSFVKDNFPRLPVTALDLSPSYVKRARKTLHDYSAVAGVQANAEALPFAGGSRDIVTNIYLFHELPKKVRPVVAREIARVLKPGGLFVFVDSLQYGDRPGWDSLLEMFPAAFHEPYYMNYLGEDIPAVFREAGLEVEETELSFLSKRIAFRKPA